MRKRLLYGFMFFVAVGFMMSAFAAPTMAEDKVLKWRVSNSVPRMPLNTAIVHGFCEDVTKASGGRLVVEDIYDGEGIPGSEVFGAVKSGLAEMGLPYMAYNAGEFPAGVIEIGLPGLILSLEEYRTLIHEAGWKEVLRKAYAEHNVYWLDTYHMHSTHVLTKEPIKSLDDFKGMKLRAVGPNSKFFRNIGGSPVSISFGEMYTALATGVIDGTAGSPLMDISDLKLYELAKYLYSLPISGALSSPVIVNMDAWKKLPDDLKAILEYAAAKLVFDYRSVFLWELQKQMKVMKDAGMQWSPDPSNADKTKWLEAGRKIWPEYEADSYCKELIKIQSDFVDMLAK